MKICKQMVYYVAAMGTRYYFGRASRDILEARVTLDRARRAMPGEVWDIVAIAA